jgi:protein OS-9
VVFSNAFISETEAQYIIAQASSGVRDVPNEADSKSINSANTSPHSSQQQHIFDPEHETYELMVLNHEPHLCTIPIVDIPIKNETSEAEARAAEQKELARATDRGWELLQELEGQCLYFASGWWSYAFCYNNDITQFHQLPPQPGKPMIPPQRDPTTKQFVLGKAKVKESKEDEWGNQIDVRKGKETHEPPKTELQVKGDSRYLVQKMEGGTVCDLTGKPRRVEVQFHCNPHVTDRIGYIKEVTTCSYLMVVYTPRLCNDVAFMPQKETKANSIVCRAVVPEDEIQYRSELKTLEAELASNAKEAKPTIVGGLVLGGGKWMNKEGQRMPIPANFGQEPKERAVEIIARAKSKADGGQVEMASDTALRKLDLDPEMIERLKKEIQEMAKEKGWKIEVVDEPGQDREILGIVDGDGDDDELAEEEGSEELFYKDEL